MNERSTARSTGARFFAPFLVGDFLLLVAAGLIYQQAERPMNGYEIATFALSVALAAWFGTRPFVLRHQAELKLAELNELASTVAQIERVEDVAHRIDVATGQWQTVQEHAARTMTAAREITDRMVAEQKDFRTFLEHATGTERNHLRLEVNKLRRAEGDWLQAFVRVLDHVYALYCAGARSGQNNLIEQFSHFQEACRDAARRVGLVPVVAAPGTRFDAEIHQLTDTEAAVPEGAVVEQTLGTGYAFQGQLLRRAVVTLRVAPTVAGPVLVESFSSAPPPITVITSPPEGTGAVETAPAAAAAPPAPGAATPGDAPTPQPGETTAPASESEPPAGTPAT